MKKIIFYLILFVGIPIHDIGEEENCSIISSNKIINENSYYPDVEVLDIKYRSDMLEISGFIVKPRNITLGERLPLIILNRGGNRNFGAIKNTRYLEYLSSLGYVVMASQYRGNIFSEGEDEFGGSDLNDIKCLIEIAKNTDYIDSKNIGVLGYSRGGLMAYELSRDSDDIKTIVTVGAPTDMFLSSKNRPLLYKEVYLPLIGDSISKRKEFIGRSAIYWYDKINEPTLVIHGEDDARVNIEHSKRLVDSAKKGKHNFIVPYFIKGGDHGLSNFKKERNDTIAKWFEKYLKS